MKSRMIVTLTLCVPTLKGLMSAVVVGDIQETGKYVQVGELLSDNFRYRKVL